MIEKQRILELVDQIEAMSAADMKEVARFGRVKNYSAEYRDIRDAVRALVTLAKNVHGIELQKQFNAIDPIRFTGMIPNDLFIYERDRMVELLNMLLRELDLRSGRTQLPTSVGDDVGPSAPAPTALPRVIISTSATAPALLDIKRGLVTADYDVIDDDRPLLSSSDYSPIESAHAMRSCEAVVICLFDPLGDESANATASNVTKMPRGRGRIRDDDGEQLAENTSPENDDAQANDLEPVRERTLSNTIAELGAALGRYPEQTFFIVSDTLFDRVPKSMQSLISFRVTGDTLSFEDVQALIHAFKQSDWSSIKPSIGKISGRPKA